MKIVSSNIFLSVSPLITKIEVNPLSIPVLISVYNLSPTIASSDFFKSYFSIIASIICLLGFPITVGSFPVDAFINAIIAPASGINFPFSKGQLKSG